MLHPCLSRVFLPSFGLWSSQGWSGEGVRCLSCAQVPLPQVPHRHSFPPAPLIALATRGVEYVIAFDLGDLLAIAATHIARAGHL